jgi:dihydrofolate synthase/folylpolyglutamate synthase
MEEILPEVFVDGAHNEDGIRAFLDKVREDGCRDRGQRRTLLFSVVSDKDYKSMITQVLDSALFDRILVAHLETKRAATLESLHALLDEKKCEGVEVCYFENVRTALSEALAKREGERIYIAGSLYLVGEIKEFLRDD